MYTTATTATDIQLNCIKKSTNKFSRKIYASDYFTIRKKWKISKANKKTKMNIESSCACGQRLLYEKAFFPSSICFHHDNGLQFFFSLCAFFVSGRRLFMYYLIYFYLFLFNFFLLFWRLNLHKMLFSVYRYVCLFLNFKCSLYQSKNFLFHSVCTLYNTIIQKKVLSLLKYKIYSCQQLFYVFFFVILIS